MPVVAVQPSRPDSLKAGQDPVEPEGAVPREHARRLHAERACSRGTAPSRLLPDPWPALRESGREGCTATTGTTCNSIPPSGRPPRTPAWRLSFRSRSAGAGRHAGAPHDHGRHAHVPLPCAPPRHGNFPPATCFLHDGNSGLFPDLPFRPAALLLTRVVQQIWPPTDSRWIWGTRPSPRIPRDPGRFGQASRYCRERHGSAG